MRLIAWSAFAAALLLASPAFAGHEEKGGDDPSKFFMFYGDGQPVEVVRADLSYCLALAGRTKATTRGTSASSALGGLITGYVDAVNTSGEQRRRRDSSMRTCMAAHGYSRYYLPEAEWNPMMRGEGAFERMLAYMTGPVPTTRKLPA